MKQPERVAELLAELRALTENDFERHRIDVLERDLHEPPRVEQVDDTHQRFDGLLYRKGTSGHYSSSSHSIHRAVFSYYNGEIPAENVIHHIDDNPANNQIENLQSLLNGDHIRLHKAKLPDNKICPVCGKLFEIKEHHIYQICCSRACATQWRRNNGNNKIEKICAHCGQSFSVRQSRKEQKYCSHRCFLDERYGTKTK